MTGDYLTKFKQQWINDFYYDDVRKILDKQSRHPYDVMYNILNITPKSVRNTPEFIQHIEYTMNDWYFTAPEIHGRAWNRMFDSLKQVTNVDFSNFESNPKWVQTAWNIYAGNIKIEN